MSELKWTWCKLHNHQTAVCPQCGLYVCQMTARIMRQVNEGGEKINLCGACGPTKRRLLEVPLDKRPGYEELCSEE